MLAGRHHDLTTANPTETDIPPSPELAFVQAVLERVASHTPRGAPLPQSCEGTAAYLAICGYWAAAARAFAAYTRGDVEAAQREGQRCAELLQLFYEHGRRSGDPGLLETVRTMQAEVLVAVEKMKRDGTWPGEKE